MARQTANHRGDATVPDRARPAGPGRCATQLNGVVRSRDACGSIPLDGGGSGNLRCNSSDSSMPVFPSIQKLRAQAAPYPSVPRLPAPSRKVFVEDFVRTSTPAIFRGMLDDWPAFGKWNLEFLRQHHASLDVLTFPVRDRLTQANAERGSANIPRHLGECLERISKPSAGEGVVVTTWFSGL